MRVLVDAASMSALSENVLCDALLERVFFSLLSNAVKYSPQNGTVVVTITLGKPDDDNHPTKGADENGDGSTRVTGGADQKPLVDAEEQQTHKDLSAYTFHFRNSTVAPMRVAEVDRQVACVNLTNPTLT